jgi:molybdopterin molybdotransferase
LARLKGFQKLTPVDVALQKFFSALQIKQSKTEAIPLHSALNRIIVEDIIANVNLPRFDRSAVDGYAVKSRETAGATQFKPRILQLTSKDVVREKQAKQVWTGNPIPRGADAVVMLEDTKQVKNEIEVWSTATPSVNVSKTGEDVRKGETAVAAGTRLKAQHLGLLAALGTSAVNVFKKPKIAVLATGNELAEVGNELKSSQVFDVNRLVLSSLCIELGAETLDLGIARDDVDVILTKLKVGLDNADAVITSGGTSVGGSDVVPDAVNKIGKPGVVVHGVAMRPAMPTALGIVNGKAILVLPGNPVAAMVGFEVFARPLIFRMLGMKQAETRFNLQAKIKRRIAVALGRKNYVRVRVFEKNHELLAEPISARGSSMISTMTRANGYVVVPENREGLEKGEMVSVQMFDTIELVDDQDV